MKIYFFSSLLLLCSHVLATPFSLDENLLSKNYDETKDLLELSLEELLEVEVVVASQTEETIFDAPSSVTVFTRQQLQRMGVNSAEELLNFVPGFFASRESVFADGYMVSARGTTTPQSSYNILFLLDGQRLNNELRGGALDIYGHFLSLANIKQIEIIRGPGSASYGTGAVTGVVNIITATDLNDMTFSVNNLDSRDVHLNLSRKGKMDGKNWSWSLFARYFEDQGQSYPNVFSKNPATVTDPRQGRDVQFRLQYDKLQLNVRHNQRREEEFYIINYVGDNYSDGQHNFISVDYNVLNNKHWDVHIKGNYTQATGVSSSELASQAQLLSLPPSVKTEQRVTALQNISSEETSWQLGINGEYRFNADHIFLAGISHYHLNPSKITELDNYNPTQLSKFLSQKNPAGDLTYYDPMLQIESIPPNTTREATGLYLQHKYKLNKQFALTWGARYDHYSDVGNSVTPRVALVYSPSEKTKFKWMYGEAFRAPAIRNIVGTGIANPNLKPEKIKTMELAWLQQHRNFQSAVTYFYSRALDRIDTGFIPGSTDRRFINVADNVDTAGVEIEASTQINKNFSLRAAYTRLQKTEENPRRFPKQTFSWIANYHYGNWDFNVNGFFHDAVQQQLAGSLLTDLSAYWVINSNVRYTLSDKLTLFTKINNLFDEEYYSSTKTAAFTQGLPNRGRTYAVGVEWKF